MRLYYNLFIQSNRQLVWCYIEQTMKLQEQAKLVSDTCFATGNSFPIYVFISGVINGGQEKSTYRTYHFTNNEYMPNWFNTKTILVLLLVYINKKTNKM